MGRFLFPLSGVAMLAVLMPASEVFAAEDTCYVDSVNGDDGMSGLSEVEAVKSQAKVASTCTVVRYKRGSQFNEKLKMTSKIKIYTNYGDMSAPLPKFVVPRTKNSGPVAQGMMYSGWTIDGLYMAGAAGDGTMSGIMGGICVMVGANSKLLNSEIVGCDIGAMLNGEGGLAQGNYIHDMIMGIDAAPGVDPNLVGGAQGIFINASKGELAYNTFVNCKGIAEWVGWSGDCDGGATEVSVASGATMVDTKVHHNYSYNNCGFVEIATYFGSAGTGVFKDADFYNNVSIDSGWMALLQVNNTEMANVKFFSNTFVSHKNTTNDGILAVVYTAVSSGMSGRDIEPNAIFLTNNFFVVDGVTDTSNLLSKSFEQTTNLIIDGSTTDPGFATQFVSGKPGANDPHAYELTEASPAVNAGTLIEGNTLDFYNRTVPVGVTDIGAFELGATQVSPPPAFGQEGTGGSPTAGTGRSTIGSGGNTARPSGSGGKTTVTPDKGGAAGTNSGPNGTGGKTTVVSGKGGTIGSTTAIGGTAGVNGTGGSSVATSSVTGGSGGASVALDGGVGGGGTGGVSGLGGEKKETASGCTCKLGPAESNPGMWVSLIGLALLVLRRRGYGR
jgi:MYXO-CTERM domain-containing protein